MIRTPSGHLRFTIILEFGGPVQWVPGGIITDSIYRYWWLWFAVAFLRVSFREFAETKYIWIGE